MKQFLIISEFSHSNSSRDYLKDFQDRVNDLLRNGWETAGPCELVETRVGEHGFEKLYHLPMTKKISCGAKQ
jgi:hypothetical protein